MRKSGMRFISAALAACMMASVLPVSAFASGGGTATDPESSISTQAAVTDRVLKNGDTISSKGEYILSGNYTKQIIIDSTDPVTINIDGNVNYTVTGRDLDVTNALLYVKNVPELTINGKGGKVSGNGAAQRFLYAKNNQPTMRLTVEGGTYLGDSEYSGIMFYVAGTDPNATNSTNVFLNNVTATGSEAVQLVNCDATITGGNFYGTNTYTEDEHAEGTLDIKNGTVTINHANVADADGVNFNSIANDGGTVTVNGGECKVRF